MNSIVIVFLPESVRRKGLEAELRRYTAAADPPKDEDNQKPTGESTPATIAKGEASPLWMWFVPNPTPGTPAAGRPGQVQGF